MGKFVLKTATNGQTYFRLQAGNGESILASEMYKTKAAAEKGIESVRINSIDDVRYERKLSAKGQPMFNLKAARNASTPLRQSVHKLAVIRSP